MLFLDWKWTQSNPMYRLVGPELGRPRFSNFLLNLKILLIQGMKRAATIIALLLWSSSSSTPCIWLLSEIIEKEMKRHACFQGISNRVQVVFFFIYVVAHPPFNLHSFVSSYIPFYANFYPHPPLTHGSPPKYFIIYIYLSIYI